MAKRNLLLCFDAFGTLFTPKRPVHQQYGEVARSLGMTNITDEALEKTFRAAIKQESRENPNYGKANGLNATKWWTNIINNTFRPLLGPQERIHPDLAPRLLYRFATEEAYTLHPDVRPLLQRLPRSTRASPNPISSSSSSSSSPSPSPSSSSPSSSPIDRVVVGVVTNSDDRVPEVLTSLGLRVSPYRFGREITRPPPVDEVFDIDFCVMSYDVGAEKPDARIFAAAERMLAASPLAEGTELGSWDRVYVGDDYEKDVLGAAEAGWTAVLVSRAGRSEPAMQVDWLDGQSGNLLDHQSGGSRVSGFETLEHLSEWLPKTSE